MSWAPPTQDEGSNKVSLATSFKASDAPPPWLAPNHGAAAYAPAASSEPSSGSSGPVGNMDGQGGGDVDGDIPRMIMYTRIINLVLSMSMLLVSSLTLVTSDDATSGVLGCYVVVFSCLLCCYETHLKQISKVIALNFGFLYNAKSRVCFMFFVGSILFSFKFFAQLIGCLMFANAFFNIYVIMKYPGFEDAQRQSAQSEIQELLAANPAFAQKALALGLAGWGGASSSSTDVESTHSSNKI
jgi:hypothetical protein